MRVVKKIIELRKLLKNTSSIGCVPTMGNIHDGHLSLVSIAKNYSHTVVTTIFVNRLQFNKSDDYKTYPRTFDEDYEKLRTHRNDIVFCPDEKELYPFPQDFFIDPPKIAKKLEGRYRPGHFRGVCTVVMKLFNIIQPQIAVFGKKDYQQLSIIRGLVDDFALPIDIVPAETVRLPNGLALSSRNRFLTKKQYKEAPRLQEAMQRVAAAIVSGDRNFVAMEYAAGELLARHGWIVDYVVVRTQRGLLRPSIQDKKLVILGAASLGSTRLIDDLEVDAP